MRLWTSCAALALMALACSARSEPVTVDALLNEEDIGDIRIDPTGQYAVVERLAPFSRLPRYDFQFEGAVRYGRLDLVPLSGPASLTPLLPMEDKAGYTAGPFSPDGARLAVFRLQGETWRLGVVDILRRSVIWTDVAPETGAWGRSVEWLSNDSLAVIGSYDGDLPRFLTRTRLAQSLAPGLWRIAAEGSGVAVAVNGASPHLPHPPRSALWRADARTGRSERIATGDFLDLEASPDGALVALFTDAPIEQPRGADVVTEPPRSRSLTLVDIDLGRAYRPEATMGLAANLLAWSADSSTLLVYAEGRDRSSPGYVSVDRHGEARRINLHGVRPETGQDVFFSLTPQAGWLAASPLIFGTGADEDRAAWWRIGEHGAVKAAPALGSPGALLATGPRHVILSDSADAVLVDDAGAVHRLGPKVTLNRTDGPLGFRSASDPMKAKWTAFRDQEGRICRIHTPDMSRDCRRSSAPDARLFSWSSGADVRQERAASGVTTVDRIDPDGRSTGLLRLNPHLETIRFSAPVRILNDAGASGWLYLPPDLTPGEKAPLVVIPYMGAASSSPPREMEAGSRSVYRNGQVLVAAGYAVLFPDLPAVDDPSAGIADRILAVVDAAAASHPVDAARVGLWGHSFGAWTAVMAAAQSDRFAAVVAMNGAYDPASVIGSTTLGARFEGDMDFMAASNAVWLESGQAHMFASYWRDPDRYRRNSALDLADQINAPVMFVAGDLDHGLAQAEQMYGALYRLGRPVALVTFFGEDHVVFSPGNVREMYARTIDWFDRHLRAAGVAAPSKEPGRGLWRRLHKAERNAEPARNSQTCGIALPGG